MVPVYSTEPYSTEDGMPQGTGRQDGGLLLKDPGRSRMTVEIYRFHEIRLGFTALEILK